MKTRIVVGLLGLPVALIPIWLGGIWSAAFFLAIALIGGLEFYNVMQLGGYQPSRWLGSIWIALLVLNGWIPQYLPLTPILVGGLIVVLVNALYHAQHPVNTWMSTGMGAVYMGIMLGQSLAMRQLSDGLWWILYGVLITWTSDSAAYFMGVTIGKHKLWPRVSPKKTWEGTISGWIASALSGGFLVWLLPLNETILFGMVLGTACGVLALLGDLSISMLKRHVGLKDSGHLFPGHGGMLDRLDSILFVMPFIAQVILYMT